MLGKEHPWVTKTGLSGCLPLMPPGRGHMETDTGSAPGTCVLGGTFWAQDCAGWEGLGGNDGAQSCCCRHSSAPSRAPPETPVLYPPITEETPAPSQRCSTTVSPAVSRFSYHLELI